MKIGLFIAFVKNISVSCNVCRIYIENVANRQILLNVL